MRTYVTIRRTSFLLYHQPWKSVSPHNQRWSAVLSRSFCASKSDFYFPHSISIQDCRDAVCYHSTAPSLLLLLILYHPYDIIIIPFLRHLTPRAFSTRDQYIRNIWCLSLSYQRVSHYYSSHSPHKHAICAALSSSPLIPMNSSTFILLSLDSRSTRIQRITDQRRHVVLQLPICYKRLFSWPYKGW